MDAATPIEDRRLALQADLDSAKTPAERNRLGQFATPTMLANDVLAYAGKLLPTGASVRFLDPAVGTGSFYSALLREFRGHRIEDAVGFEIDPHYGGPAAELWRGHQLRVAMADFTACEPPRHGEGFNLVICNPPYVRHHHLDRETKARLLTATEKACGVQMAGLAGLYCHFLGLAHPWMAPDGIAGWLIPSEFMDVNYGIQLKRYLLNRVELIRVHRFDPNELQFGDALVSSAIVWFRNRKGDADHGVEFSYGGTLAAPKVTRTISASSLGDSSKWTGLAADGLPAVDGGPRLRDFFDIKRGVATGDNGFFIMSRERIEAHDLPMELFTPILPGPRHLSDDLVEADAGGLPKVGRALFMLDCRSPEEVVRTRWPALWAYLQTGRPAVAGRYLCSHRSPWYAQERRPAAPFMCTYMGRGLAKRDKPFRFILNRSRATAANVYLLLYPKRTLARALSDEPGLDLRVWDFLKGIDAATLLGEGRVYGGGLYKLEPKELANVPAGALQEWMPADDLLAIGHDGHPGSGRATSGGSIAS